MLCEYRVFYIMEMEIVILFHGAVCGGVVMYGSMIGEYDVHQLWFMWKLHVTSTDADDNDGYA